MKIISPTTEEISKYGDFEKYGDFGTFNWNKEEKVKELKVTELKVKKDNKVLGWKIKEEIGIGIVNPKAVTKAAKATIEKDLTEEEKEILRIENKNW